MPEPTLRLFDGFDHTSPDLNDDVRRLQALLNEQGIPVSEDGYFGRATESALMRFQVEHALDPDGIAGPLTWSALRGADQPEPGVWLETSFPRSHPSLLQELPLADSYRALIVDGADLADVPAAIICGIGSRESRWGLALTPPGPSGTGDTIRRPSRRPWRTADLPPDGGGFGRGLLQIDFDAHEFARTGPWREPDHNIRYGCGVLKQNIALLRRRTNLGGPPLLRAAIAAYNCGAGNVLKALELGRGPDYFTHGRNYAKDVLNRAGWFQLHGWR